MHSTTLNNVHVMNGNDFPYTRGFNFSQLLAKQEDSLYFMLVEYIERY